MTGYAASRIVARMTTAQTSQIGTSALMALGGDVDLAPVAALSERLRLIENARSLGLGAHVAAAAITVARAGQARALCVLCARDVGGMAWGIAQPGQCEACPRVGSDVMLVTPGFAAGRFVVELRDDGSGAAVDATGLGDAYLLAWEIHGGSVLRVEADGMALRDLVAVADAAVKATGADTRFRYPGECLGR